MKREADKTLEQLIVRSLDGALSDEEQLSLDRELIRNPDARELRDEYRRIDSLSVDALRATLSEEKLTFDPSALSAAPHRKARWSPTRTWWLIPGAIAAAMLAVFIARFADPTLTPVTHDPSRPFVAHNDHQAGQSDAQQFFPATRSNPYAADQAGLIRNVGMTPRIQRDTGREVIGVWGEDGNLYLLEIDRTRALRRVPDGAVLASSREPI